MRSPGWTFAVMALGCGGSPSTSGPGPDLHKIVPIQYDLRPEMAPDSPWGGWTDGTVAYEIGVTTPGPTADVRMRMWDGQQVIMTIDVATARTDPGFDDAGFSALLNSPSLPTGISLDGVLHAQGQGYTSVGGNLSYDINGDPEDLSAYAEGGVVFYAKAGANPDAPATTTLSLKSPDFSAIPLPGGVPTDTSAHCGNPGYGDCYDFPTVSIPLSAFWRQFVIPLQSMHQAGFGYPVPDFYEQRGLSKGPVSSVSGMGPFVAFDLPKSVSFDFWLAGFGFYTKATCDKLPAN